MAKLWPSMMAVPPVAGSSVERTLTKVVFYPHHWRLGRRGCPARNGEGHTAQDFRSLLDFSQATSQILDIKHQVAAFCVGAG